MSVSAEQDAAPTLAMVEGASQQAQVCRLDISRTHLLMVWQPVRLGLPLCLQPLLCTLCMHLVAGRNSVGVWLCREPACMHQTLTGTCTADRQADTVLLSRILEPPLSRRHQGGYRTLQGFQTPFMHTQAFGHCSGTTLWPADGQGACRL